VSREEEEGRCPSEPHGERLKAGLYDVVPQTQHLQEHRVAISTHGQQGGVTDQERFERAKHDLSMGQPRLRWVAKVIDGYENLDFG
jgi:hypothetical protein